LELGDLVNWVEWSEHELKSFKQKAENDIDEIHTDIYNMKRDMTKFKSTADLQQYIDDKLKWIESWLSTTENDTQRSWVDF